MNEDGAALIGAWRRTARGRLPVCPSGLDGEPVLPPDMESVAKHRDGRGHPDTNGRPGRFRHPL